MKQNPGSVDFGKDYELMKALKKTFKQPIHRRPKYIVEAGTYHGLGTTYNIVHTIRRNIDNYPRKFTFYTIEADYGNYKIARHNWRNERWVHVIHGLSVDKRRALKFIETDEALLFHQQYPDILIDSQDPIPFYKAEIEGALPEFASEDQGKSDPENNVFDRILPKVKDHCPLIVLDSCGGIGWLEFQQVLEICGRSRFYLLLHDINHVKHFRSYEYIKHFEGKEFSIKAEKPGEWVYASHFKKAINNPGGRHPGGKYKKKKGRKYQWK